MKPGVPQEVLLHLGLEDYEPAYISSTMDRSDSWYCGELVLQRREFNTLARLLPAFALQRQLSVDTSLLGLVAIKQIFLSHGDAFIDCELEQSEKYLPSTSSAQHLWIISERLYGATVRPEVHSSQELMDHCVTSLDSVFEQLEELARMDLAQEQTAYPLAGDPNRQTMLPAIVQKQFRSQFPEHADLVENIPGEPTSVLTLSHGDPIVKNVIISTDKNYLIDWESVQFLPRHRDLTRPVSYLHKYLQPEFMPETNTAVWERARQYLPGWDKANWDVGVYWQTLREYLELEDLQEHQYISLRALKENL